MCECFLTAETFTYNLHSGILKISVYDLSPLIKLGILLEAKTAMKAPPKVIMAEGASRKYLTPVIPALKTILRIMNTKHSPTPSNVAISTTFPPYIFIVKLNIIFSFTASCHWLLLIISYISCRFSFTRSLRPEYRIKTVSGFPSTVSIMSGFINIFLVSSLVNSIILLIYNCPFQEENFTGGKNFISF